MAKISFQQDLLDATQSILRGQIPPTKGICLNVALAWNPHRTKTSKREIKKSAEDLAKWIQHRVQSPMPTEFFLEELPDWDETVSESLRGLIAEIRIFTYPVTENPGTGFQDDSHVELCSSGGASCRPCAGEAEIKKAIQEKNSNIPDYRKELQGYNGPIWLLLTCNFDDFGMPPDYPDPHVDVACDHEFQRVFLIDHQSDIMIEIFHSKATHH